MSRPDAAGRVTLVETSDLLPGLLPFHAWDALGMADVVLARDAAAHPWAGILTMAGLDLVTVAPATLDRGDLDLTRPGGPAERRLAKSLVAATRSHGAVCYLLEPDESGLAPALAGMVAEHDVEIELVFLAPLPAGTELLRAVEVMRRLRDPDTGCPWDLEQDHESLARYLVEETYELIDAIGSGDDDDVREELGDVLLQVLFHARIADERRTFDVDGVARGLADKLVRRHPHVFADAVADTADDVQRNWDRLKATEKGGQGPFDGVPTAMPGLALLDALLRRARRLDMLPPDAATAADGIAATASALAAAVGPASDESADGAVATLLGSLLVQAVGLARLVDLEADAVARRAAATWREGAERVVAAAGDGDVRDLPADVRLAPWPSTGRTTPAARPGATPDPTG
jgi:XTP/dITP diphosphohydrolase